MSHDDDTTRSDDGATTADADATEAAEAGGGTVVALRPRQEAREEEAAAAAAELASPPEAPAPQAAAASAQQGVVAPLDQQLEALLFVSPTPLTSADLAEACEQDEDDVQECLVQLMDDWAEGRRGVVLERVAGGWAFRASDLCRDQLARLVRPQGDTRLSPSALETLAIIAYLQPVSRPDIAKIRGVAVDAAVNGLLDRGFIEEAGRSETGAVQFRTTALFERAFGLSSLGALPDLEGFGPGEEEVARMRQQLEKMAEARVE